MKTVINERETVPAMKVNKADFLFSRNKDNAITINAGISQKTSKEKLYWGKGLPKPNFDSANAKKLPEGS